MFSHDQVEGGVTCDRGIDAVSDAGGSDWKGCQIHPDKGQWQSLTSKDLPWDFTIPNN